MAASSVIFQRIAVCRGLPCRVRVLCHSFPAPETAHCRPVHSSPVLSAKSYLYKFTSNNKKRHWYDSTFYLPVEKKPPGLLALMKKQQVEKRGNNVRHKVLNGILYNAVTSLLNTSEVSEEVYSFCIELSKVSVSADFSVCRVYWLSSGNKETDAEIEEVLQKYAPRFRHLMISHHVLGNVPPVVFVRDKEDAKRRQVEELLATLQFEDDDVSSVKTNVSRKPDTESVKEASAVQLPSIFSIDHSELNQQIAAYKKKIKDKVTETDSGEHSERQQEQLAAIRKQKFQRKKMKKQKGSAYDISPQDYELISAMDLDRPEELDLELYENIEELDEEEEPNSGTLK